MCLSLTSFSWDVYVEVACNTLFGAGEGGMIAPPNRKRQFTLGKVELCTLCVPRERVLRDLEVLTDMAKVEDI